MAAKDLVINLLAHDKASAEIKKVGSSMSALERQTKSLHTAGQLIGAGAIIAFGAASVKAYAEAEVSQVKLQEAYRKFPAIASVNISAMRDLNSAIQAKTGTDDDELAAAEAKLAMYNLTGEQIQKLIPIVNDYAVANGIGVTEAAGKVGKAMLGNAKALKDIGINFKATGDKAKDFDSIYSALEGKVGGAGEAFGASTAGQLKILQASFGDLQEEIGAQLVPALQTLVGIVTPVLGAFSKMPEPLKTAAVAIGLASAAALVAGPRILSMVGSLKLIFPAATQATGALTAEAAAATAAGTASSGAASKVGMLGKSMGAIGIGVTATLAVAAAYQFLLDKVGAGADAVNGLAAAVAAQDKEAAHSAAQAYANAQATGSWSTQIGLLAASGGLAFPAMVTGYLNAGNAASNLDEQLSTMVSAGSGKAADDLIRSLGMSAEEAAAKFPKYAAAVAATASPFGDLDRNAMAAGEAVGFVGQRADDTYDSVKALKKSADELKASLEALGGKAIDLDSANAALQKSYDDALSSIKEATKDTNSHTDAVKENRTVLDLNTEAGRTAQAGLQGIAEKSRAVTTTMAGQNRSTKDIAQSTKDARAKFLEAADAAGLTAGAAKKLADRYGLIPDKVATLINIDKAQAILDLAHLKDNIDGFLRPRTLVINIEGHGNVRLLDPSTLTPASGGYIQGPGTGTSDSIPAMLSNGEYVVRASSVQRLGVPFLHSLNRYADGGLVTSSAAAALTPAQLLAKFVRDTATAIRLEQGLMKLREDMASQSRDTKNSVKSFASLTNSFDTKAYKTAQADVATARARLNSAATPAERTAALADLDQAQAAARTSKPTAGNVIAGLKAKLNVIKSFGSNVRKLAKMGIPRSFLEQIIDAGPEEGGELAKALLDAKPADIRDLANIQRTIDRESGRIGNQRAHIEYDPLISRQRGLVNSAVARAGADRELLTTQVVVNLDGKEIASALAAYKRSIGGRKLGLD